MLTIPERLDGWEGKSFSPILKIKSGHFEYGAVDRPFHAENRAQFQALGHWHRRGQIGFSLGSVKPVKPVAPVVIYWGTKDTAVPPIMHELYQKQMCAMGANVGRNQLPGEQTHFTTPGVSAPMYLEWVKDRVAGKPLANACPKS